MNPTESQIVRAHEFEAVICSPVMLELMERVQRVAPTNCAVLIMGETGTGKEFISRAIHAQSRRASRPWVDVNCAALPEHLVESELFGYERGAFSGAGAAKPGMFELADKGTLFLDEVGELDLRTQVKLLRVLDGAPYYRLGGSRKVAVDVRIIAATNRPLEQMVRLGRFRNDLIHRLGQMHLRVPPLRERPEEIVVLAQYFLERGHPGVFLSMPVVNVLQSYPWPGNVRELKNVVLQAAMNARGEEITLGDLPAELLGARTSSSVSVAAPAPEHERPAALEDMEKQAILSALGRTGGHRSQAAEQLGISRRTLSRKLKQYRISGEMKKQNAVTPAQHHFRGEFALPVTIHARHGEQVVQSVNVSLGGIAVEGVEDSFQLAGTVTVTFSIPGDPQPISARAQIVWADATGRAGLRYTRIEENCVERLKAWLVDRRTEEGWTPEASADTKAESAAAGFHL